MGCCCPVSPAAIWLVFCWPVCCPGPTASTIRLLLIALLTLFGLVTAMMGFIHSTWIDLALMVLLGVGNGYITIILFTSIQSRAPKAMLGRIMSLLMLASTGLVPISQALSGVIVAWNLSALFVLAGGLIVLVTFWAAFQPALGTFSEDLLANVVIRSLPQMNADIHRWGTDILWLHRSLPEHIRGYLCLTCGHLSICG